MANKNNLIQKLEEIILLHRNFIFQKPIGKHVVYIMSGGLDSTIGVAKIINEWKCIIHPLFIRRGGLASKWEERAYDLIEKKYLELYPQNFVSPKKINVAIPPKSIRVNFSGEKMRIIQHGWGNSILQTIHAVAVQYTIWLNCNTGLNIKTILTGSVGDDIIISHDTIQAFRAHTILTCIDQNDWAWQISSPYIDPYIQKKPLFKHHNIIWAVKNGIPFEYTRTCRNGCEVADGTCIPCRQRLKSFQKAGIKDPIKYQNSHHRDSFNKIIMKLFNYF